MTLRAAKIALVFAVGVFYSFVVFNNTTDYDSNFQFARHVLMMDSTFPGNHAMWRALSRPAWYTVFYLSIIAREIVTMILCWWGGVRLAQALHSTPAAFHRAKRVAIVGLALGLLMWVAFLSVGGEWFLMWQSKTWNGQESAFRLVACFLLVTIFVMQAEGPGPT